VLYVFLYFGMSVFMHVCLVIQVVISFFYVSFVRVSFALDLFIQFCLYGFRYLFIWFVLSLFMYVVRSLVMYSCMYCLFSSLWLYSVL